MALSPDARLRRATTPPTLLDAPQARAARDEAMATVEAFSDPEWVKLVDDFIGLLAATGRPFTSDDVWRMGVVKPREPRALGPRFMAARTAGLIERTGVWRPTAQVLRHACPIAEWIGLLPPSEDAARIVAECIAATMACPVDHLTVEMVEAAKRGPE